MDLIHLEGEGNQLCFIFDLDTYGSNVLQCQRYNNFKITLIKYASTSFPHSIRINHRKKLHRLDSSVPVHLSGAVQVCGQQLAAQFPSAF